MVTVMTNKTQDKASVEHATEVEELIERLRSYVPLGDMYRTVDEEKQIIADIVAAGEALQQMQADLDEAGEVINDLLTYRSDEVKEDAVDFLKRIGRE